MLISQNPNKSHFHGIKQQRLSSKKKKKRDKERNKISNRMIINNIDDLKIVKYEDVQKIEINYSQFFLISLSFQKIKQEILKCFNLSSLNLDLSETQIDISKLGQTIAQCQNLNSLTLNLSQNYVLSQGSQDLGQGISKNLNLKEITINLQKSFIDSTCVAHLGEGIVKCQKLTKLDLDLRQNTISDAKNFGSWIELCQRLTSLTIVLSFDQWGKTKFGNELKLGKYISKCQDLNSLTLNLYNLNLSKIVSWSKKNSKLTSLSLHLGYNKFGSKDLSILGRQIAKCQHLTFLLVDISSNGIKSDDAVKFVFDIIKCEQLSSLSLFLEYNEINSKGLENIAKLISQCSKLNSLTLNLSNHEITSSNIGSYISKCLNLTHLKINNILHDNGKETISDLTQGVQKLSNLTSLFLEVGSDVMNDIKNLSLCISNCKLLTDLSLVSQFQNSLLLGDDDLFVLGQGISQCQNIISLMISLYFNGVGSVGISNLVSQIAQLQNLVSLNLNLMYNNFDSGIQNLGNFISKCQNLSFLHLDLRQNKIDYNGALHLMYGISQCKKLTSLNLYLGCQNNDSDKSELNPKLKVAGLSNLTSLNISLDKDTIGIIVHWISKCEILTSLSLCLYNPYQYLEDYHLIGREIAACLNLTSLTLNFRSPIILSELIKRSHHSSLLIVQESSRTKYLGTIHRKQNTSSNCSILQSLSFNAYNNCVEVNSLSECQALTSLIMYFYQGQIGSEGVLNIGSAISKCQNLSSLTIYLINQNITTIILKNLINSIGQCEQLAFLALYFRFMQSEHRELKQIILHMKKLVKYELN